MSLKTFQRNSIRLHQAFQPVLFALGLLLLFGSGGLDAREVPSTLTFQATLSQDDGTTFSCQQPNCITFRLFETETDGTAIWEEQQGPFNVRNGAFSVRLGRNEPLSELPFDTIYFLELQVADSVLSPRLELSTVPYSITSTRVSPGSIRRESIAEGAVDRDRIAPGSVDRDRIAPGAVDRDRIQPGAVDRERIAPGAVDRDRIAPGAVDRDRITPGAVSQDRLAERAVGRGQMEDRAVGRDQLDAGAVGRQQLEAGAVGRQQIEAGAVSVAEISSDGANLGQVISFDGNTVAWAPPAGIADGSIVTSMLADDAVTLEKLAEAAVATSRLADAAVTGAKLADGAVDATKIADGAVGAAQLADGSVSTPRLADAAVTPEKINTDDAEAGDVLIVVNGSLSWAQPPGAEGLVLPFVGEATEVEAAFEARNVGGEALVGRAAPGLNAPRIVGIRGEATFPTWLDGYTYSDPMEAVGVLGRVLQIPGQTQIGLWGRTSQQALDVQFPVEPGSFGVVGEGDDVGVMGIGHDRGLRGMGRIGVLGETSQDSELDNAVGVLGSSTSSDPLHLSVGVAGISPHIGMIAYRDPAGLTVEEALVQLMATLPGGMIGAGLFARSPAQGPGFFAGYFDGRVKVSGNLDVTGSVSKSAGSFRIDHPLDPANKWLYHSFVESPDMMNVYNGNAELDETGEAVVVLPDYFAALNSDFRYQLTAIGAPGPYLHIAEEIQDNQFRIAGGLAGSRVSWQVTGIRRDLWAEENRIEVETLKAPEERGRYYGQQ